MDVKNLSYTISKNIVSRVVEDYALILHFDNDDEYIEAKGISFEILKLFNTSKCCSRHEIIEKIFPSEADEQMKKNLDDLLNKFIELKIIEIKTIE